MTKRELINALESLPISDDTEVMKLDSEWHWLDVKTVDSKRVVNCHRSVETYDEEYHDPDDECMTSIRYIVGLE